MTPTAEVDVRTKKRLDRLRADVERETGRTITDEQLVARIVELAVERWGGVVDSSRDSWEGLTDEGIGRILSGTIDSGTPLGEDEIDDVIYDSDFE